MIFLKKLKSLSFSGPHLAIPIAITTKLFSYAILSIKRHHIISGTYNALNNIHV